MTKSWTDIGILWQKETANQALSKIIVKLIMAFEGFYPSPLRHLCECICVKDE